MTNPQFIEEKPLTLAEVKTTLESIQGRDENLNYLSNKAKDFLEHFVSTSVKQKEELYKKLSDLNLTRIKDEHLCKIIDFMPVTVDDLKVVLQAYPLSLPKKDQEAIVSAIKGFKH
ncbi:MAG: hypothetical protein KKA62_00145 [Nanoarchaeota archaeon]|nr:hypothetical protein [Nanoarchaeota archaeon]MBU1644330.1 hypothetical protein [Nanoarchaeota archaeon]MBU1976347.1 hypothetical protein [Nanoarchaeota archaeon]